MTDEEALEKSKLIAVENNWPFKGVVNIRRTKRYCLVGKKIIRVISNSKMRGGNIFIIFCAKSGDVLHQGFGKR